MKTLIIDNYDSFTFNLFQYVGELQGNPVVYRNDEITLEQIKKLKPSHIIISPGPGTAEKKGDFGINAEVIEKLGPTIPLLGVCLGHQGIAHMYGSVIEKAPTVFHGKQSLITHEESRLFAGIPRNFKVMRYHSLCVAHHNFPKDLRITALEPHENVIMALEHVQYPIYGIQFHPESFMTEYGKEVLKNFLCLK